MMPMMPTTIGEIISIDIQMLIPSVLVHTTVV